MTQHATFFIVPDSKNPVEQEAPKKAEYNIRPGVPGIQLHEACSVQVQILEKSEKTWDSFFFFPFFFHLGLRKKPSKLGEG